MGPAAEVGIDVPSLDEVVCPIGASVAGGRAVSESSGRAPVDGITERAALLDDLATIRHAVADRLRWRARLRGVLLPRSVVQRAEGGSDVRFSVTTAEGGGTAAEGTAAGAPRDLVGAGTQTPPR